VPLPLIAGKMTRARLDSVVTVIDADAFHATLGEVMAALASDARASASPASGPTAESATMEQSDVSSSAATSLEAWSPDAAQRAALRAQWPVAAWEQLHAADVVLLNKTDLLVRAKRGWVEGGPGVWVGG
jgi:G3E family GTPase